MSQNEPEPDIIALLQQRLPERPIIILSQALELNSSVLNIQDYVMGGETVIPLFSSQEAFAASTRGADLGRPLIQIKRELLVQVLRGHEIFLLDPQLEGQLRFSAEELRRAFPEAVGGGEL